LSKGSYIGGGTVIGPGGQGWSYDPLEPVRVTDEGRKQTSSQKKSQVHDAATARIKDFALACAACRVLAIGDISPDQLPDGLSQLLDAGGQAYHKPFRLKIGGAKPEARQILIVHIETCIAAEKAGTKQPALPMAINYCRLHRHFGAALAKKIKVGITEGRSSADLLR